MARTKVTAEPQFHSWGEVDLALKEIGSLTAVNAEFQAKLDAEIALAKSRYEVPITAAAARIKRLEKDSQEFAEAHREELEQSEGRRSKQLNWGVIGFRRSKVLDTLPKLKWSDVVEVLKKFKMARFLRVKEEVDKVAVKTALDQDELPEAKLERFGMRLVERDTFGYELSAAAQTMTAVDPAAPRPAVA